MKETKAIFFDFDGTIADTVEAILLTMKQTMQRMGRPVPPDSEIIHTIGLPLQDSVAIVGGFDPDRAQEGVEIYRSLFPSFEVDHIQLFPKVSETLQELHRRGVRMAICTSRGSGSLERILRRHNLWDLFETMVTVNDGLPSKPAPDMVLVLLERMNLTPGEAIVVGDTTFDIGMGSNAGCRTCAVTYGNHTRAQLEEAAPTWIVDDFSEILNLY